METLTVLSNPELRQHFHPLSAFAYAYVPLVSHPPPGEAIAVIVYLVGGAAGWLGSEVREAVNSSWSVCPGSMVTSLKENARIYC